MAMLHRRPSPRTLLVVVLAGALLAGGWFWLRDSSLVAVQDVEVTGVSGPQAEQIRSTLRAAARDSTTLHVRQDVLRDAVATLPAVRAFSVSKDIPHGLTIAVEQRKPVAVLVPRTGQPVPVSADGVVLRGDATKGLPQLSVDAAPTSDREGNTRTLTALALVDRAPLPLREEITTAFLGRSGLTVHLRRGPSVRFGSSDRLSAKWLSLSTVLASGQAAGATRIDVRVPERPAATGLEQGAAQIGPSTSP